MDFTPDDDPSRARREEIIRFFKERGERIEDEEGFTKLDLSQFRKQELIRFLKEHGMPLGDLEKIDSCRILIIGGSPQLNDQVRELLPESDGLKFEIARNGFEAGIQAESFHPHVIVIDFEIGFAEALMIAANLRKSSNHTKSLIIGLANKMSQTSADVVANGFNEIISKPIDVIQLCNRIRAHFDLKQ